LWCVCLRPRNTVCYTVKLSRCRTELHSTLWKGQESSAMGRRVWTEAKIPGNAHTAGRIAVSPSTDGRWFFDKLSSQLPAGMTLSIPSTRPGWPARRLSLRLMSGTACRWSGGARANGLGCRGGREPERYRGLRRDGSPRRLRTGRGSTGRPTVPGRL
jgi:hypothetical protein